MTVGGCKNNSSLANMAEMVAENVGADDAAVAETRLPW